MTALPPPEGHHTITPAAIVPGAAKVIEFLKEAFGGEVVARYDGPEGIVAHAEVMIDGSVLMLGDPMPGVVDAMPAALSYYVKGGEAVDATYERALQAGATSVSAPEDRFYGYRSATVLDPGGNRWTVCAVIEEVSHEEMDRRMSEMMKGG